jgi:hypothetical protein
MKVESDVLNQPPHKTKVHFYSIYFGIDLDRCKSRQPRALRIGKNVGDAEDMN